MRTRVIIFTLLLVGFMTSSRADIEGDLLAVLQSPEGDLGKIGAACLQLRLVGTAKAIPILKDLLAVEETSHAARMALEALPYPEAKQALMQASEPPLTIVSRAIGWRMAILNDPASAGDKFLAALRGDDPVLQEAAMFLIRQEHGAEGIEVCMNVWKDLPVLSQLAVLDASVIHLEEGAEDLVVKASQHEDVRIRTAAWRSTVALNAEAFVPELAKAASGADESEKQVAYEALTLLHGPGIQEAIVAALANSDDAEAIVLLRAMGQRKEVGATSLLLEHARNGPTMVQSEAVQALSALGDPMSLGPLLQLLKEGDEDLDLKSLSRTLRRLCGLSPDKMQATREVVRVFPALPPDRQVVLFPVLPELGTELALAQALSYTRIADPRLSLAALQALGRWPTPASIGTLLAVAKDADGPNHVLALRGAIEVSAKELDPHKRLQWMGRVLNAAKRPDETRLALSQLGTLSSTGALSLASEHLSDATVVDEAALAVLSIAEKLAESDSKLVVEAAEAVERHCEDADLLKRAAALRKPLP